MTTGVKAELRYAPNRMPIVVDVMHDLIDETDEGDEDYWDWLTEIVPEEKTRAGLRRFIFASHMENAN